MDLLMDSWWDVRKIQASGMTSKYWKDEIVIQ